MSGEQTAVALPSDEAKAAAAVEAEQAFSEGYGAPEAKAPGAKDPSEDAQPGDKEPAKEEAAAAPAKEPVLIHGIPEEEWNAAVVKAATPLIEQARGEIRKNFGQVGEVNKALKEIRETIAAGGSTASRKKITAEALRRVNEELPGLGDALAQDLAEFLDSPGSTADAAAAKAVAEAAGKTFDADAYYNTKIGPALAQVEARANERAELRIVKSIHRDFDDVMKSPEFAAWLGALPEDERAHIRDSDDGLVAADAVTDFKAHRKAQAQARPSTKSRLEAALTPAGDRQPSSHIATDEEADLDKGFKSVR